MLTAFAPKEGSFKATLKGGRVVELTLRPYALSDMAWQQNTFTTEKDALEIAEMKVEPISKMIWHQLDSESKAVFMRMKFVREDDNGKEIEDQPEGYQRFIEGVEDVESLMSGFFCLGKSMTDNGFLPDENGSKKKTMKSKTPTSGQKSMTWWQRLTA